MRRLAPPGETSLTPEDSARYEAMVVAELGEECAHWLAMGQLGSR